MFKTFRIAVLLLILLFVSVNTWLTQARSTDWNNSLYLKIYPINGDGSDVAEKYVRNLKIKHFRGIEEFAARYLRDYEEIESDAARYRWQWVFREGVPAAQI